jgi:hypothetical protein
MSLGFGCLDSLHKMTSQNDWLQYSRNHKANQECCCSVPSTGQPTAPYPAAAAVSGPGRTGRRSGH